MITEQIGKGQKYDVIKRVISVVITDFAVLNTQREDVLTMLAKQKPMLRKMVGILQELSHDERTRLLYEQQEKWRMDYESSTSNATRIGLKEGRRETAKKMKANGLSVSTIAACTDLSVGRVRNQERNNQHGDFQCPPQYNRIADFT